MPLPSGSAGNDFGCNFSRYSWRGPFARAIAFGSRRTFAAFAGRLIGSKTLCCDP
jgi:hypothetical protein